MTISDCLHTQLVLLGFLSPNVVILSYVRSYSGTTGCSHLKKPKDLNHTDVIRYQHQNKQPKLAIKSSKSQYSNLCVPNQSLKAKEKTKLVKLIWHEEGAWQPLTHGKFRLNSTSTNHLWLDGLKEVLISCFLLFHSASRPDWK